MNDIKTLYNAINSIEIIGTNNLSHKELVDEIAHFPYTDPDNDFAMVGYPKSGVLVFKRIIGEVTTSYEEIRLSVSVENFNDVKGRLEHPTIENLPLIKPSLSKDSGNEVEIIIPSGYNYPFTVIATYKNQEISQEISCRYSK